MKSSRDIKVSRAAVRSEPVLYADIDQIFNTLQQNMDISDEDDKLESNTDNVTQSYGCTPKIQIRYDSRVYSFQFDAMDLAFDKQMTIGTDLMTILSIGYTGLATPWDPPCKDEEESPFKDIPAPNEDRTKFFEIIDRSIQANKEISLNTFCTHPDAVIYLNTPEEATGYRSQYPIADTLKPKVQETVEEWLS
ncbi:hypothetical protein G6F56_009212 [Rhizopus delemar]|nr:hypothetical protein G6F56_009212 [Rhizopus delemar]